MIKKSKFTAVLLSAVFAASLIAGCGNSASSSNKDTTSEADSETATDENTSDSEDTASSDTESDTDSDSDAGDGEDDTASDKYQGGESFTITSGDYAGSTLMLLGSKIFDDSLRANYKERNPDVNLDDSVKLVEVEISVQKPESANYTGYDLINSIAEDMSVSVDGANILSNQAEASGTIICLYVSVPDGTKSFDLTYDNGTDKATFEVPLE